MFKSLLILLTSLHLVSSLAIRPCPLGSSLTLDFKGCHVCPDPHAQDCIGNISFDCYPGYQLSAALVCKACPSLYWAPGGMNTGSWTKGQCLKCSYQATACGPTTGKITKCLNGGNVVQTMFGEVCQR